MDARTEVLKLFRNAGPGFETKGLNVVAVCAANGMWFADFRVHAALRALEREHVLLCRQGPPTPERGYRPSFHYRLNPIWRDE